MKKIIICTLLAIINLVNLVNADTKNSTEFKYKTVLTTEANLNDKCRQVCKKPNSSWTGTTKENLLGMHECECKINHKKAGLFNKEKQAENLNYRSIGFDKNSDQVTNQCPAKCSKNNEKFTGNWKPGYFGRTLCECKIKNAKERKDPNTKYRSIGMNKDSKAVSTECPITCDKYGEKYSGNWKKGAFNRTLCECTIEDGTKQKNQK